ncbi:hypothetical protein OG352_06220 [Streptomyces sp. NBC_01485]|uniref:hypothetical protein n=1 Tax=Streptomyces sp. NBC_01485 TaxID=2903884 RepID=UPI002E34E0DF|nr:hypothetical protein [Streptomyces sp. NBC_01485]
MQRTEQQPQQPTPTREPYPTAPLPPAEAVDQLAPAMSPADAAAHHETAAIAAARRGDHTHATHRRRTAALHHILSAQALDPEGGHRLPARPAVQA